MPYKEFGSGSIEAAIQGLIRYLEDTGKAAHNSIYFDGWDGLAASAVLGAIAEDPPPSLKMKFDKIIHIDCSMWESRRAVQRKIAYKLNLPERTMAFLDRQDMEDDFSGIDQGSRYEIENVTEEISKTIWNHSCLMIFHNGSDDIVDVSNFGFPQHHWPSPKCNKVLWTFGRRLNRETKEKVESSHLLIYTGDSYLWGPPRLILREAAEVVKHTQHKQRITPGLAAKCITYLIWLNQKGGGAMDYNWDTHASNYWVCDGIIEEGQFDESWELSADLHQHIQIGACSSPALYYPDDNTNVQHWKSAAYTYGSIRSRETMDVTISPNITSFFLIDKDGLYTPLPLEMFQQSERLHVLKLSRCSFSFNSPPFHHCQNLRFLGLDCCKDQRQGEEDKQGRPVMGFFQNLWVLDVSHMDWELDLSPVQLPVNIREVHIKKGRIWRRNLAWRLLHNLRKLRIIEPTSSWETDKRDEFTDMTKLELLDLSGNSTIQVLPSLSGATSLKTLVLDGCVGLGHVGPEELPPSLESFSLDATSNKLYKISLAGCERLKSFLLRGAFPCLAELNLSNTSVRKVDLSDVAVPGLKKLFLIGCKQLHAILWWTRSDPKLEVLRIDTLGSEEAQPCYSDLSPHSIRHRNHVVAGDARFIQSLKKPFLTVINDLYLDLHVPLTSSKSKQPSRDEIIPKPCCYNGILLEGISAYDSKVTWPPPLNFHVEVGEGINLADVESKKVIKAIWRVFSGSFIANNSLHVHDNSCTVQIMPKLPFGGVRRIDSNHRWCRVERCPKLQAVFVPCYRYWGRYYYCFENLENVWASDLLAAKCIWAKGTINDKEGTFKALQSIQLHNCPRLKFVLPVSSFILPSLETLHIACCGDLELVFPWDVYQYGFPYKKVGMKEFPKLKHIQLHELPRLKEICEAKMSTPMLESIKVRGCWSLKCLPAVSDQGNCRPVVNCEKDWWEKLKWDGLHANHDPSLYEPCHSVYYKKRLLRGRFLR